MEKAYSIRVYHTHIEVYPYTLGDMPYIEKMYSKWDEATFKYIVVGYHIENDTLYLPKGTSLSRLSRLFKATPVMVSASDPAGVLSLPLQMTREPRDRIQKESIDFLVSDNEFKKGIYYTQYGLNLNTGDGKTYCMIAAIAALRTRAIVITHKTRIKDQWYNEFLTMTDISEDKIMRIEGSSDIRRIMSGDVDADIFIVNHQTLAYYARDNSWEHVRLFFKKLRVGIKIIDEAHKFFRNTLLIDFFSDVKRSYYLTATFTRNDPKEIKIYNTAFSQCYRFGEETIDYEERRKHIVFMPILYRSKPTFMQIKHVIGGAYGFNSYRYIDYALKGDPNHTMMKVLKKIIHKIDDDNLEGRILITSPKIESINMIADALREETDRSIGCIYSKQSKEKNAESFEKDIISTTINGIGEGDNVKGLRVIINVDPIGSKGLADQLRGRLREYSPTEDTYMFYLIDMGIQYTHDMYKRIEPVMRRKCKEIVRISMDGEV